MASTLPTNIAVSTTGHPGLHNAVNAAVNEHDGRIASLEGRATALEGVAQIVGAGRPDVTASMTTSVQAQVTAAPVGATFSSTDGASVGAWQWQKLPAGWTVGFGDTGFRDITGLLSTGWTASTLKISRVGFMVTLIAVGLTPGPAATSTIISNPFTNLISPHSVPIVGPTPSGIGSIVLNGSGLTGSASIGSFSGTGTWRTWGNWPATLIGVAA